MERMYFNSEFYGKPKYVAPKMLQNKQDYEEKMINLDLIVIL